MKVKTMYYRTSDALLLRLDKEHLRLLLQQAKEHFFEYLYNHTEYYFYKQQNVKCFGLKISKEYIKITENEALEVYNQTGFQQVVLNLEDKKYYDLFTNYDIILNLDKKEFSDVLINDFKLLLDIAGMSLSTFKEMTLKNENK